MKAASKERASRAQEARRCRLAAQHTSRQSPLLQTVNSMPDSFSSMPNTRVRRSRSRPDTPVTPILRSRFVDADMAEEMPLDEMKEYTKFDSPRIKKEVKFDETPSMETSERSIERPLTPSQHQHQQRKQQQQEAQEQVEVEVVDVQGQQRKSARSRKSRLSRSPSPRVMIRPASPRITVLPKRNQSSEEIMHRASPLHMKSKKIEQASPSQRQWKTPEPLSPPPPPPLDIDAADRGGGHLVPIDVIPSAEKSKPEHLTANSSLEKLIAAFGPKGTTKPDNLSEQELALWNTVQQTISSQRSEWNSRKRALERKAQDSANAVENLRKELDEKNASIQSLEQDCRQSKENQLKQKERTKLSILDSEKQAMRAKTKMKELKERREEIETSLKEQQEEHDLAIRAIQRVLADVTAEKDLMKEAFQEEIRQLQENLKSSKENASAATIEQKENKELKANFDDLQEKLKKTERERKNFQDMFNEKVKSYAAMEKEVNQLQIKAKDAGAKAYRSNRSASEYKGKLSVLEADKTKLIASNEESNRSLENAKMLISSLESANSSMAAEHRTKLKENDELIQSLQAEASERQTEIDNLATAVRILQTDKEESDQYIKTVMKQQEKQKGLTKNLEQAVADLEAVALSDQSTEEENTDRIATMVCNTLVAIKIGLAAMENRDVDDGSLNSGCGTDISTSETSVNGLDQKELERQVDTIIRNDRESAAKQLRDELKDKDDLINKLRTNLQQEQEQNCDMKKQNQLLLQSKERSQIDFSHQMKVLQDRHNTNVEALTKKSQEFEVLKGSLQVGDDGFGYISADESDDEEEEKEGVVSPSMTHLSFVSNGGVEVSTRPSASDVAMLRRMMSRTEDEKERALRDLQEEKESLANAKMIISSLEKANKTMLEDLRSRLQDSNTAIASLLDKSMENERVSNKLKEEIEKIRKEKEEAEEKHKVEIRRMQDTAMVADLRLAERVKELEALKGRPGKEGKGK